LTQVLREGDHKSLEERLQRRERELQAVYRITAALHARTDLDELQRQTLDAAVETVGASDGTIFLHEPREKKLVFTYVLGAAADRLIGTAIREDQGIAGEVLLSGEGRITLDPRADKSHSSEVDERVNFQTKNMITVPLKTMEGRVIGVMQVLNKQEGPFDPDDLKVLEIVSSLAASALDTARLHQEARLAQVVHRIGDISHDVKNMVTPIVTGTQTLELMLQSMFADLDGLMEDASLPETVRQRLCEMCAGVRSWYPEATQMTYDGVSQTQERVREIADAVKGTIAAPRFEPTNVNDVAKQVARTLDGVAKRGGVTIDLSQLDEVPLADLDRNRMYNALYNLVNNAIPETPSGGTIFLQTSVVSDESGERLQVVVRDTGRGMPEEIKTRLFTDQAPTTKVGGTGLGTLIVKRAVDAHRGTITVESEAGVGTAFTIRVPLQQVATG
jgi:signal transduction histidine kinase